MEEEVALRAPAPLPLAKPAVDVATMLVTVTKVAVPAATAPGFVKRRPWAVRLERRQKINTCDNKRKNIILVRFKKRLLNDDQVYRHYITLFTEERLSRIPVKRVLTFATSTAGRAPKAYCHRYANIYFSYNFVIRGVMRLSTCILDACGEHLLPPHTQRKSDTSRFKATRMVSVLHNGIYFESPAVPLKYLFRK